MYTDTILHAFHELVLPLHLLYRSIHTIDESKDRIAFAFIFGLNWHWRCGVTVLSFFMKWNVTECQVSINLWLFDVYDVCLKNTNAPFHFLFCLFKTFFDFLRNVFRITSNKVAGQCICITNWDIKELVVPRTTDCLIMVVRQLMV